LNQPFSEETTMKFKAPFTPEELDVIEWELNRAAAALKQYADKDVSALLNAACYIMAEVRNAGRFLSSPDADAALRSQVADRLLELFATAKKDA
jgi:hypothetical protein